MKTKTGCWRDVVFVIPRVSRRLQPRLWRPKNKYLKPEHYLFLTWPGGFVSKQNWIMSTALSRKCILKRNVMLKHKDVSTCLWSAEMCRQFTLSGLEWWYRSRALKDGWQNNILQETPASDVTAERNTPNGFWFNLKDEETAKVLWRESKYLWNLDFILT